MKTLVAGARAQMPRNTLIVKLNYENKLLRVRNIKEINMILLLNKKVYNL